MIAIYTIRCNIPISFETFSKNQSNKFRESPKIQNKSN